MYKGVQQLCFCSSFVRYKHVICELQVLVVPDIMVSEVGSHCHGFIDRIHILCTCFGLEKSNRMFSERVMSELTIVGTDRKVYSGDKWQ